MHALILALVAGAAPHAGSIVFEVSLSTGEGNEDYAAAAVAWSPDGSLLVGAGRNGRAVAWDARTRRERFHFDLPAGERFAVAFHPGGERFALAGSDDGVYILGTKTGGCSSA